ncbi:MAG TPA: hypothetical protein VGV64_00490 [Thermoplasmata archaeon]|nr:hypothetical protein [Thermoplasmata archaeon]
MNPNAVQDIARYLGGTLGVGAKAPGVAELGRALKEYRGRSARPISDLRWASEGRTHRGFLAALADPRATFRSTELDLPVAPAPGAAWGTVRPFRRLAIASDGPSEFHPPTGSTVAVVVRALLREHWAPPGSPGGNGLWGGLPQLVALIRGRRIVPFGLALEVYRSEERVRYEIDLVDDRLLPDPRDGRLASEKIVHRSARIAWAIDRAVAPAGLAPDEARLFETVAESNGLGEAALAAVFPPGEAVHGQLARLVEVGLLAREGSHGVYRVRRSALKPEPAERAPDLPRSEPVSPALRATVVDLIAAADAQSTCPLCGDVLPVGHPGLVCARCEADVRAASLPP